MKTEVGVRGFFIFSSFFPLEEAPKSMDVEDGENGASAGRVEGGTDAPAAHARPSEHAAGDILPCPPLSLQ